MAVGRLATGSWPDLWKALSRAEPPPTFPLFRLAVPGALLISASPHLSRAARRLARWLVVVAGLSALLLGATTPSGALAGVLVAVTAAAAVHLVFGSTSGQPSMADVRRALEAVGAPPSSLGAPDRQPSGYFLVHARDADDQPLVVKVYGRDAHDTQLLSTLWRTVWYREAGSPLSPGRLQQVEHEAFLTLQAGQIGLQTERVVTAGATGDGDVLLVLRPIGRPLAETPERWSTEVAANVWSTLGRLHRAGIAHGQVDDERLVLVDRAGGRGADDDRAAVGDDGIETARGTADGAVGLVDFRGAVVAASPEQLRADEAQALVATVLGLGIDAALDVAREALGPDQLARVLPFIQRPALTGSQRTAARTERVDLDELRDEVARRIGIDPPALQQLRRVTWGSLLQIGLLGLAFVAVATALAGVDLGSVADELQDADWWIVGVGFLVAQLPRFTQSISTLGASPIPLPLGPVYALQLAISYIGLAVPSAAGRVAINIRFFQRHGLPPGSAVAIGAIDGFSGFVVQATLLLTMLLFTAASLDVDLSSSAPSGLGRLLVAVVVIGVLVIVVLAAVPRLRKATFGRARELLHEAVGAVRGLRSPRRLALLFGGNLATELLFAAALGVFTRAFGWSLGFGDLLFINMSVALLAGFLPIPGGIGVTEGGLIFGLTRAGMPEEAAFAAVILYRLATFYLPPVWGFFALRWLQRNQHV